MKVFYSSLELTPSNLLGKNNKLSVISLHECKSIFEEIEKEVFANFINYKSDKVLQEITFPIIKDIIFEFYKIIRSLIEIKLCERANIKIFLDKKNSPTFNKLVNESRPNKINLKHKYNSSIKQKIKLFLKKIEKKIKIQKDFDLHNQSLLLNEFIEEKDIKYNFLWPEIFITSFKKDTLIVEFFNEKISSILKSLFIKFDIEIKYFFRAFVMLSNYVSKQYQLTNNLFNSFSNKNFLKVISENLIGGTPQILGRILNLVYISNKKKVIRFSHGGERVFFDDKLWVITELINSSEYYTHGLPEKISVENKIKKLPKQLRRFMPSKIKTIGSRKHQMIYENSKGMNNKIKKKLFSFQDVFLENVYYTTLFLNHQIFF